MIRVQPDDFRPDDLLQGLLDAAPGSGAVATFLGLVRSDGGLEALTLQHYPGMTERRLEALETEARNRWPGIEAAIVHRHGRMLPGERIVWVGVASSHRQDAFSACEFLMDRLKTGAPFWKLEEGPDGSRWVAAKAEDDARAERWTAPAAIEPASSGLTHFDAQGRAAMVDVGDKPTTRREAVAKGRVTAAQETLDVIRRGAMAKGDVLAVARLAGIMGAKRTAELIPLCHPLSLTSISVDLEVGTEAVEIVARCGLSGQTGVEMEALTAVSVAALTVYDMCKAIDRSMRIGDVRLVHKSGGRSGTIDRE